VIFNDPSGALLVIPLVIPLVIRLEDYKKLRAQETIASP
jgi:hypothetical protein